MRKDFDLVLLKTDLERRLAAFRWQGTYTWEKLSLHHARMKEGDGELDELFRATLSAFGATCSSLQREIELCIVNTNEALDYMQAWIFRYQVHSYVDLNVLLSGAMILAKHSSPGDTVCVLGGIYRKARTAHLENVLEVFKQRGTAAIEGGNTKSGSALLNFEKTEVFRMAKRFYDD